MEQKTEEEKEEAKIAQRNVTGCHSRAASNRVPSQKDVQLFALQHDILQEEILAHP